MECYLQTQLTHVLKIWTACVSRPYLRQETTRASWLWLILPSAIRILLSNSQTYQLCMNHGDIDNWGQRNWTHIVSMVQVTSEQKGRLRVDDLVYQIKLTTFQWIWALKLNVLLLFSFVGWQLAAMYLISYPHVKANLLRNRAEQLKYFTCRRTSLDIEKISKFIVPVRKQARFQDFFLLSLFLILLK